MHCLHLKGLSPEWMSRCFLGRQHDCKNICTMCTRKAFIRLINVTNVAKILLLLVFFNIKRKLFDFLTFMNQTHIINSTDISIYFTGTYYLYYPNHVTHIHLIFNKRWKLKVLLRALYYNGGSLITAKFFMSILQKKRICFHMVKAT